MGYWRSGFWTLRTTLLDNAINSWGKILEFLGQRPQRQGSLGLKVDSRPP